MNIVVADCSRTLLDLLQRQIEERGDTVRVFSDGLEARNHIRSDPNVDVLISGLELKGMSGLELCWDARVNVEWFASNYIIVMSSSSDVHKLIEALDCGIDDFLRKPFVAGELYARLRTAERELKAERQLIRLATIDPLTGVFNRRAFFNSASAAIDGADAGEPVCVIMLDIDHFKKINDVFGHEVGDTVLIEFAQTIGSDCPVFARLGGEEFAAILIGHSQAETYAVAEEMRIKIGDMQIHRADTTVPMSCSFGVARQQAGDDLNTLLRNADKALYVAKNTGRNKTVIFNPDGEEFQYSFGDARLVRSGRANNA